MEINNLDMLKNYENAESIALKGKQALYTEEPSPVFTEDDDGSVTVSDFPKRLLMSTLLLANPRFPELQVHGDLIRFVCANGEAEYRIVDRFSEDETVGCERVGEPVWK